MKSLKSVEHICERKDYCQDKEHENHAAKYALTKPVILGPTQERTFALDCAERLEIYRRQVEGSPGQEASVLADFCCCRMPSDSKLSTEEITQLEAVHHELIGPGVIIFENWHNPIAQDETGRTPGADFNFIPSAVRIVGPAAFLREHREFSELRERNLLIDTLLMHWNCERAKRGEPLLDEMPAVRDSERKNENRNKLSEHLFEIEKRRLDRMAGNAGKSDPASRGILETPWTIFKALRKRKCQLRPIGRKHVRNRKVHGLRGFARITHPNWIARRGEHKPANARIPEYEIDLIRILIEARELLRIYQLKLAQVQESKPTKVPLTKPDPNVSVPSILNVPKGADKDRKAAHSPAEPEKQQRTTSVKPAIDRLEHPLAIQLLKKVAALSSGVFKNAYELAAGLRRAGCIVEKDFGNSQDEMVIRMDGVRINVPRREFLIHVQMAALRGHFIHDPRSSVISSFSAKRLKPPAENTESLNPFSQFWKNLDAWLQVHQNREYFWDIPDRPDKDLDSETPTVNGYQWLVNRACLRPEFAVGLILLRCEPGNFKAARVFSELTEFAIENSFSSSALSAADSLTSEELLDRKQEIPAPPKIPENLRGIGKVKDRGTASDFEPHKELHIPADRRQLPSAQVEAAQKIEGRSCQPSQINRRPETPAANANAAPSTQTPFERMIEAEQLEFQRNIQELQERMENTAPLTHENDRQR